MKHIIQHLIAPIAFFFLALGVGNGQTNPISTEPYELLYDHAGFDVLDPTVQTAADELQEAVPDSFGSFQVFDMGTYVHLYSMSNNLFDNDFQDAITKASLKADYFLLFGRENTTDGLNTRIRIHLVLPLADSCFTQEDLNIKSAELQYQANEGIARNGKSTYRAGMLDVIAQTKRFVEEVKCCWETIHPRSSDCFVEPCTVERDLATRLDIGGTDIGEWLMDDLNLKLQCEVQTKIYEYGGFNEVNKATARFALMYLHAKQEPASFRITGDPNLAEIVRRSGMDRNWPEFNERVAQYETAFNKQLEFRGGGGTFRKLVSEGPKSFSLYFALASEMTDIISSTLATFKGLANFVVKSSFEQWFMMGLMTLKWSLANLHEFTPIGDALQAKQGFEQIQQALFIQGSYNVALGLMGVFPIFKIVKSVGLLAGFVKLLDPMFSIIVKGIKWINNKRGKGWNFDFKFASDVPILKKSGHPDIDVVKIANRLSRFYKKVPYYVQKATVFNIEPKFERKLRTNC